MNIQLIEGTFNSREALELLSQMIQVKIRFHEGKIAAAASEEDMQYRETRISQLQHAMDEVRHCLLSQKEPVQVNVAAELEMPVFA